MESEIEKRLALSDEAQEFIRRMRENNNEGFETFIGVIDKIIFELNKGKPLGSNSRSDLIQLMDVTALIKLLEAS